MPEVKGQDTPENRTKRKFLDECVGVVENWEVALPVGTEVLGADKVVGVSPQGALFADEGEIFGDHHSAVVEEHMMVGAQA